MSDPRIERLARLLVNYCVEVGIGDKVALMGDLPALPLMRATYRHILHAGGHPLVLWQEEEFQEILLKEGNDDQIQHVADPVKMVMETYDCRIAIRGTKNTRTLSSVDPARQQLFQSSRRELMAISMNRSATGEYRWVVAQYPTPAVAQDADMSLADYEDFVYAACFTDKEDPETEWRKLSQRQQRLVDWLAGKETVKILGPNIDMSLSIDGRTFVNSDGRRNMPSGEIFTGPVEASVNGWVRFTYPVIYAGREVDQVELHFEDGQVVSATADKNEAFLHSVLDTDAGARFLGEFAIGTNDGIKQFTKSTLFDEKIGGTIHMALGAGYPQTGSVNKSAIHWDMICDMRDGGKIWVDDEAFYDSGRFLILE